MEHTFINIDNFDNIIDIQSTYDENAHNDIEFGSDVDSDSLIYEEEDDDDDFQNDKEKIYDNSQKSNTDCLKKELLDKVEPKVLELLLQNLIDNLMKSDKNSTDNFYHFMLLQVSTKLSEIAKKKIELCDDERIDCFMTGRQAGLEETNNIQDDERIDCFMAGRQAGFKEGYDLAMKEAESRNKTIGQVRADIIRTQREEIQSMKKELKDLKYRRKLRHSVWDNILEDGDIAIIKKNIVKKKSNIVKKKSNTFIRKLE